MGSHGDVGIPIIRVDIVSVDAEVHIVAFHLNGVVLAIGDGIVGDITIVDPAAPVFRTIADAIPKTAVHDVALKNKRTPAVHIASNINGLTGAVPPGIGGWGIQETLGIELIVQNIDVVGTTENDDSGIVVTAAGRYVFMVEVVDPHMVTALDFNGIVARLL